MPDVALIGDRTFLFEKLFQEIGASYQFLQPSLLGSPFLPQFKMIIIPAGFANPQYSNTLPALQRQKSNISDFVFRGGVLAIFGPLVPEHDYEWLPVRLRYVCEYGPRQVEPSKHECSCFIGTCTPECDGYLLPGQSFDVALQDQDGRTLLAAARHGQGLIVATSVHEFPAPEFLRWALCRAKEAKI